MNAYAQTPPRDRRQGRRLLTMRNTMYVALVVLVAFTLISVASELRKPVPGEFGRLYEARPTTTVAAKPQPVVIPEGKIVEYTNADPLSIETMNREEILGVTNPVNPVAAARDEQVRASIQAAQAFPAPEEKLSLDANEAKPKKARFAISGGAGGIYTAPAQ